MESMLCSSCGSNEHSSVRCPNARIAPVRNTRVAVGNSVTRNNAAGQAVRDIAPYDACIRSLQRCLVQLESELDDQIALRAQIKKVEQALKILRGGVIASSVAVDVPDVVARGDRRAPEQPPVAHSYARSQEGREAQSKRMKAYWAARREAKATA